MAELIKIIITLARLLLSYDCILRINEQLAYYLQSLHRDINCLADDNRGTRKRALEKIRKEVFSKKPHFSATVLQVTFEEILKPALKLFADPTEKCRELSVQLVSE